MRPLFFRDLSIPIGMGALAATTLASARLLLDSRQPRLLLLDLDNVRCKQHGKKSQMLHQMWCWYHHVVMVSMPPLNKLASFSTNFLNLLTCGQSMRMR